MDCHGCHGHRAVRRGARPPCGGRGVAPNRGRGAGRPALSARAGPAHGLARLPRAPRRAARCPAAARRPGRCAQPCRGHWASGALGARRACPWIATAATGTAPCGAVTGRRAAAGALPAKGWNWSRPSAMVALKTRSTGRIEAVKRHGQPHDGNGAWRPRGTTRRPGAAALVAQRRQLEHRGGGRALCDRPASGPCRLAPPGRAQRPRPVLLCDEAGRLCHRVALHHAGRLDAVAAHDPAPCRAGISRRACRAHLPAGLRDRFRQGRGALVLAGLCRPAAVGIPQAAFHRLCRLADVGLGRA
jgi:hypothetical protein